MIPVVRFMRWADVDPALREFDPSLARTVALDVIGEAVRGKLDRGKPGGVSRESIGQKLDSALVGVYGAWIAGWNWAANEPGCGGPVRAWCCDDHSIFATGDRGALPTVDRVVAACTEWRTFLEELAALFGKLRTATAGFALPRRTEHAASRLVTLVVERTDAEDAWYETFRVLLMWFLELCGEDSIDEEAVSAVVSGRFHSWVAPDRETVAATARELGEAVTRHRPVVDSLVAWLRLRGTAFGARPEVAHRPVTGDAHRAFIEMHDRARDVQRAERMTLALDACRASARRGEPLTFDLLARWQQLVLGESAPLRWRTTDAFARHVRYAYSPDLPARFDSALAEANSADDVAVRAARVYLDICFFHPFCDGNARAARLALDYVLTRAGLGLHAIEPLIVIARAADDPAGTYSLAYLIDVLVGPLA